MSGRRLSIGLRAALAIFIVTLFVTSTWAQAPWEKVLYSFNPSWAGSVLVGDGAGPSGRLILDSRGLFGTTGSGGAYGYGTVFQLWQQAGVGWTEAVLHSFTVAQGAPPPQGSSLIFDAAGNLYGTTTNGGAYGAGTVFELRQQGALRWIYKRLHTFSQHEGGPGGSLIFDAAGNLYGTAGITVFELSPQAGGGWTYAVLHSFNYYSGPFGSLTFDTHGNLYGATEAGGKYGCGTIFRLMPNLDSTWTESVLHSFDGTDGCIPNGGLIFDAAGNLYGTTEISGALRFGVVFELSPGADGSWTEKVLYSFRGGTDGATPWDGLIFDTAGNLYGTTVEGGYLGCSPPYGCGTVLELSPEAGGGWAETVLHSFDPKCHNNGAYLYSGLIMDAAGNLYGETASGGAFNYGTVFEIVR